MNTVTGTTNTLRQENGDRMRHWHRDMVTMGHRDTFTMDVATQGPGTQGPVTRGTGAGGGGPEKEST